MNKDEEALLWQISKNSKSLIQWYDNVLKYDVEEEGELARGLRQEKKEVEKILHEVDAVLNEGKALDKSLISRLVNEERKIEDIKSELEKRDFDMVGSKGLKYIDSIEEFTEWLREYGKILEDVEEQEKRNVEAVESISTSNADYICTYQTDHQIMLDLSEKHLELSDALVLEASGPPMDEISLGVLYSNPAEFAREEEYAHNTYARMLVENYNGPKNPVFVGDVRQKDIVGDETRVKYVASALLQAPTRNVSGAGGIVISLSGISGLVSPKLALAGGLVSTTPLVIGLVSGWLNKNGIKLRGLKIIELLDPSSLRSALIAEKMEELIAPNLSGRKGGKPTILYSYGAHHWDIELYLKYPKLRRFVLTLHKAGNYPLLDESDVDKLIGFWFDQKGESYYSDTYNGHSFEWRYTREMSSL